MNHLILKHYYIYFICDCKWHGMNLMTYKMNDSLSKFIVSLNFDNK